MPSPEKKQKKGWISLALALLATLSLAACQYIPIDLTRTQPELIPNPQSTPASQEESEPVQESPPPPTDEEIDRFTQDLLVQIAEASRPLLPEQTREVRVELEQALFLSAKEAPQSRMLFRYSVSVYRAEGDLAGGIRFFATADVEVQDGELLEPEIQLWEKSPREIEAHFQSLYGETHPVRLEMDLPVQEG